MILKVRWKDWAGLCFKRGFPGALTVSWGTKLLWSPLGVDVRKAGTAQCFEGWHPSSWTSSRVLHMCRR